MADPAAASDTAKAASRLRIVIVNPPLDTFRESVNPVLEEPSREQGPAA
jgi:hypothetical protein